MATSGTISSTMTARQRMLNAAQELGVIGSGQQLDAEEYVDMMSRLTFMLKSWQAEGVNLWRETPGSIAIPADTATVTLDPYVIDVMEARLVQTSTFERPLQRWERGEYMAFPNKALPGWPIGFYIDKQRDQVTMNVWPVPQEDMDILYTYARVIEDVTDANQEVDAPQMWLETIWTNLASRSANMFGATRLDPNAVARVDARAQQLYQQLLDQDRPASVFMGSAYGYQYF